MARAVNIATPDLDAARGAGEVVEKTALGVVRDDAARAQQLREEERRIRVRDTVRRAKQELDTAAVPMYAAQGVNAFNVGSTFGKEAEKVRQRYANEFAGDEQSRMEFQSSLDDHIGSEVVSLTRHEAGQRREVTYTSALADAEMHNQQAITYGVRGDADLEKGWKSKAEVSYIVAQKAKGVPAETIRAGLDDLRSKTEVAIIKELAQKGRYDAAEARKKKAEEGGILTADGRAALSTFDDERDDVQGGIAGREAVSRLKNLGDEEITRVRGELMKAYEHSPRKQDAAIKAFTAEYKLMDAANRGKARDIAYDLWSMAESSAGDYHIKRAGILANGEEMRKLDPDNAQTYTNNALATLDKTYNIGKGEPLSDIELQAAAGSVEWSLELQRKAEAEAAKLPRAEAKALLADMDQKRTRQETKARQARADAEAERKRKDEENLLKLALAEEEAYRTVDEAAATGTAPSESVLFGLFAKHGAQPDRTTFNRMMKYRKEGGAPGSVTAKGITRAYSALTGITQNALGDGDRQLIALITREVRENVQPGKPLDADAVYDATAAWLADFKAQKREIPGRIWDSTMTGAEAIEKGKLGRFLEATEPAPEGAKEGKRYERDGRFYRVQNGMMVPE